MEDQIGEKPHYQHALVLYILWRDTSPNGEDGLTIEEITDRVNQLEEHEYEHVDRIFMGLCEDWDRLKEEAQEE
jgi:hypothetical protein